MAIVKDKICYFDQLSEDHLVLEIFSFVLGENTLRKSSRKALQSRELLKARSDLRNVCLDFVRIIGLVTECLYVPCTSLGSLLSASSESFRWSCLCPKLRSIHLNCSSFTECGGIIDVLYNDKILPFWELFSPHPVKIEPLLEQQTKALLCPDQVKQVGQELVTLQDFDVTDLTRNSSRNRVHVGFEVNLNFPTKSSDGLIIIQGILSCLCKCSGRDCFSGSFLFIQHLNLSDTCITDSFLDKCLRQLPMVEVLDFRRCSELITPFRSDVSDFNKSLKKILLDGCWKIEEHDLYNFEEVYHMKCDCGNERQLFIDIIHAVLPPSTIAEVVILVPHHKGAWVRCTITHGRDVIPPEQKSNCACKRVKSFFPHRYQYNIYVWETLKYDHAVGYSNMPAFDISRKHLRVLIQKY